MKNKSSNQDPLKDIQDFHNTIGKMGLKPRASSTALCYNNLNTAGHTEIHA